ncbi:XRE family transcriptional regulator [Vibrio harveyi]|uniref:XRE family transcriptional regulator n=1 Tax=Vibrio harveyi TaxID=669 RepID=UPI003CF92EB0
MKFADRVRLRRKIKGLTQKDVADALGITKVAVSRWELGYNIASGDKLTALAEFLDTTSEYLLDGDNDVLADVAMIDFYPDVNAEGGGGVPNFSEKFSKTPIPKWIVERQSCQDKICCIRVTGNSMEPVLVNGSVIALNPCVKTIKDGMMYVIRQGDLLRVKILIETPNSLIVRSYNSAAFPDEVYDKKNEASRIEIIGQVFWYSTHIHI